jgi:hypothetical protein
MQIGGVRFNIESSFPVWQKTLEGYDRSFFNNDIPDDPTMDLTFVVVDDPMPDIGSLTPLAYESGFWPLYRQGETYHMVFRHFDHRRAVWAASFNNHSRRIRISLHKDAEKDFHPHSAHFLYQTMLIFALATRRSGIVHGAGAGIGGKGFIFTGHADSGKSTLTSLLAQFNGTEPISDERVVIRPSGQIFSVFGTPWYSDAKIAANLSFPLTAILHIHHGRENSIIPCPPERALRQLLPQIMIPWYDPQTAALLLDVSGDIVETIPAYDLYFRPDRSAVESLMNFAGTV